jgi:hypothetical protein
MKWKDPCTKKSKKPPPEPWALLPFTPIEIDDYLDPGEPSIPSSLDRHNPLAVFKLFFTEEIIDKMVEWINKYIATHFIPKEKALKGRPRKWKPISKLELYAYFGVVIYMGIIIELAVEDYWGPIKKGAAYKVTDYILKDRFK